MSEFQTKMVSASEKDDEDETDDLVAAPIVPNLTQRILEAVRRQPELFDMGDWHTAVLSCDTATGERKCGTAHCIAGWAVVLAGDQGKALEDRMDTESAACALFRAAGEKIPDFYADDDDALEELEDLVSEYAARSNNT